MRLIDADALYERACELEAQALAYVGKIINDETKVEEWKTWSAILTERTAFKHDIYDAPTIEPERKTGRWLYDEERCATGIYAICSACNESIYQTGNFRYCPNCGARMEGEG